ncbi:FG-GAP repeat protein [Marinobacter sp. NFXS9]|uniref:FG-GAP repeat protein n=1 Tax=Marinobacter sp. NFXS9 TaxID=2818433 RepID=UPI0032DFFAD5
MSLSIESVKTFRFDWADVAGATEYRLLENPDGMSGFTQAGEAIEPGTETLGLTVPLYARVNAQYILQACNAGGCVDSDTLSVSGHLVSGIGYVKASNTDAGDLFGVAVSLSADGTTLAVGAYFEDSAAKGVNQDQDDNSADNSGAVYVFAREAGTWSQQAYLKASNTDAGDGFGYAVSLSADGATLAVSAMGEASAAQGVNQDQDDNSADDAGAVYVFTRESGTWSQQAYLKASNADASDAFGNSVSLSAGGATLAVGAFHERSADRGVNADGSDNSAAEAGAAYVFVRDAGNWSQQAYLKPSNMDAHDAFGAAVSLSADGNTLAVGANWEEGGMTGVNANESDNSADSSGAAYVFIRDSDTWTQQAYLKASNTDADDEFGDAISLSADGDTLAVGANQEASVATGVDNDQNDNSAYYAGAVYVFTREAGTWSQQVYLKASNTDAGDSFGRAVSLNSDGTTLAVGAYSESSAATGVNDDQSDNSAGGAGAAYLF